MVIAGGEVEREGGKSGGHFRLIDGLREVYMYYMDFEKSDCNNNLSPPMWEWVDFIYLFKWRLWGG